MYNRCYNKHYHVEKNVTFYCVFVLICFLRALLTNTGQKMVEWNQLDVSSFLDQIMGFLSEHGQLDGQSNQPPAKRARSVSLT